MYGEHSEVKKLKMNTGLPQSIGNGYYVLLQSEKDIEIDKGGQKYKMVGTLLDPITGQVIAGKKVVMEIDHATFEFIYSEK